MNAFKTQYSVTNKEVSLFFDGDKLSPDTKIEETELSDMDTLDAVVR